MDDITDTCDGENKEVAEMAKKVMKKIKEEVEKKGLKLSVTVWLPGGRVMSMQEGRRSDDGRQCGNAWSGFENQSQEVRSKRKSEKNKVQSEILAQEK